MKEKYLPLGSVVILKGAQRAISIIGFCPVIKVNNRQYDYLGVPYPEGYLGQNSVLSFDHEKIDKIYSVGFSNDDEKQFKKKLNETVKTLSKDGDEHHFDQSKIDDYALKAGTSFYESK